MCAKVAPEVVALLQSKLFGQGAGSLLIHILGVGLQMGLSMVLSRVLGIESFGVYAFAIATIGLLAIPGQLGLTRLVVRETSHGVALSEWSYVSGIWRWSTFVVLGLSTTLGLGFWLFVSCFPQLVVGGTGALQLAVFLLPLMALNSLRGAAVRGLGHALLGQLSETLLRPFAIIIGIGTLWWLWGRSLSVREALGVNIAATFLAYAVGVGFLYRVRPTALRAATPAYKPRAWLRSALPLTLVVGLQYVMNQADIVMLGMLSSAADVGGYKASASAAALVPFGLQALTPLLMPLFAKHHARNETDKLQRLAQVSARASFGLALPLAVPFIAFGAPILGVIFGNEFRPANVCLAILTASHLFAMSLGVVGIILSMTGHEKAALRGLSFAAVANLLLNAVLIPRYGMEGAAVATTLSTAGSKIFMYRLTKKLLGIRVGFR